MNMQKLDKRGLLIVCPNEQKMKILQSISIEEDIRDIKFMTKEEYKRNYYFSYTCEALYYLMKKYKYNLDVARVYLDNLYIIDDNKNYSNTKLVFLRDLKLELRDNNLLIENKIFRDYIKTREVWVRNYYDLDKYEEEMLGCNLSFKKTKLKGSVFEYLTLEDEVNGVCLEIIKLLRAGIPINKIYLTNITDEYYYTLEKLFSYYHIPLNLDKKESIYGTKVVYDYLDNEKLDLDDYSKTDINKKIVSVLESLSGLDKDSKEYQVLLIDELKRTYLSSKIRRNAVTVKNLYNETFSSDEYVFVLGFNQDVLPAISKDISFIDDIVKEEVNMYTTDEINKRSRAATIYVLSNIKNLYLSYKLSSPFNSFYKSSLIDSVDLEVVRQSNDNYNSSNYYNKLRLAEKLDLYYLYGEKDKALSLLYTHYQIPYKTYSNKFTGINKDTYLLNLPYPLKLSYTSLNSYSECKFKYYVKYVLNLDNYEDSFASYIGSMYHKILSLYQRSNFDFDASYKKYLELRELSLKEKLLLKRIRKDLVVLIDNLKKQELLTGFNDSYYEKKVEVPLAKEVEVLFVGYIDKIMYYQKIEDTYFSIIDYKSGSVDTHIEPMKYGLHMQLPVYLYLIHYSKVFSNPIFTGIYYQNILFNYPTWSAKGVDDCQKRLRLQGYSTDDVAILERFDSTYEKSSYIKGMAYNEEKGFSHWAKVIDNDTLYNLVKYTKDYIDKTTDDILDSDFSINPKMYDLKDVSCKFCPFNDLCYKKESDVIYLEKQEDLSFLGSDV